MAARNFLRRQEFGHLLKIEYQRQTVEKFQIFFQDGVDGERVLLHSKEKQGEPGEFFLLKKEKNAIAFKIDKLLLQPRPA